MLEKRNLLRAAVRKELQLSDSDMLVMSLSSINPPKGQKLFLESAVLVTELNVSLKGFKMSNVLIAKAMLNNTQQNETATSIELNFESYFSTSNQSNASAGNVLQSNSTKPASKDMIIKHSTSSDSISLGIISDQSFSSVRNLLSGNESQQVQNLKVLIGSLGSKSNKVLYIQEMLGLLSQHPNLSKIVFWTPATTRVAALYSAADVYVINAQGLGETFGRVTIEAMAFGLPVLGTNAGGTKEIVEHNVTGLLHPVGREGVEALAHNIMYLMRNPSIREKMGILGRQKVKDKYLKNHMYENLAKVLTKCMKIK